jgi:hypothetical protein
MFKGVKVNHIHYLDKLLGVGVFVILKMICMLSIFTIYEKFKNEKSAVVFILEMVLDIVIGLNFIRLINKYINKNWMPYIIMLLTTIYKSSRVTRILRGINSYTCVKLI